jgi:phosphoribosylformylglycinamidine synthase
MKFGVVTFPGSNCDQDMVYVLKDLLNQEVVSLWHKDTDLQGVDMVILPGGFSYGDYLRSGAIAKLSPIMQSVIRHANEGGFVMGICNGFQILCESGLLPGALLRNTSMKFQCSNVFLTPGNTNSAITRNLNPGAVLKVPIAHGEGRFYADQETLNTIEANGQVVFRYCQEDGTLSDTANPNGSLNHIAGICNAGFNVFGMMPHPERCATESLFNTDGSLIFDAVFASYASA